MRVAFDRGPRYYGESLSENIAQHPNGYLICRNAIIGRTGKQTYIASELDDPDGLLGDRADTREEIELYRMPKEVFSAATLSSFEGMPLTIHHPEELLDTENTQDHEVGHIQNVREGKEPLDDGNYPMLADIWVKHKSAIDEVQNGLRELSCGYTYKLHREGYRFEQRNILGNHVALVPKGRAGGEARIYDSASDDSKSNKEKKTVDIKKLLSMGLAAFAKDKDSTAEEVVQAALLVNGSASSAANDAATITKGDLVCESESGQGPKIFIGKLPSGQRVFKQYASDAEVPEQFKEKEKDEMEEDEKEKEDMKDEGKLKVEPPTSQFDAETRKRLHDNLDAVLAQKDAEMEEKEKDGMEEDEEEKEKDASPMEVQDLINGMLTEAANQEIDEAPCPDCGKTGDDCMCEDEDGPNTEDEMEEDAEKEEEEDSEVVEADSEEEEKSDDAEKEEADDASEIVRAEPYLKKEQIPQSQLDAVRHLNAVRRMARAQGALDALKALRPVIARKSNKKEMAAFDNEYNKAKSVIKKVSTKGGYSKFVKAASKINDEVGKDGADEPTQAQKAAVAYDAAQANVMKEASDRFKATSTRSR